MKKACIILILTSLVVAAALLCSCGKEEQSQVPLNSSIENVSLPTKGKVYYDIQVEDEGITYRNICYKSINIGEAKSYAQSLYSSGFQRLYEDASTKDYFGFSALYEKGSGGVSISGSWREDALSLTVMDVAVAKGLLENDDAEARQKAAEAAAAEARGETVGEDGSGEADN